MGLETRIMANLQAHASQGQRRWIFALAGVAVAMLAIVVITNVWTKRTTGSTSVSARPAPSGIVSKDSTEKTSENVTLRPVQKPHVVSHGKKIGSVPVLRAAEVKPLQPLQTDLTEEITVREMRLAPVGSMPGLYVSSLRTIEPVEIRELLTTKNSN
ncbi:MAG: hypothetical protein DMG67_14650 [Acidobacteria bacterium]|nr:MAG: hypothetical protein DMG67_14650 [Acidobacteriota bacterium]